MAYRSDARRRKEGSEGAGHVGVGARVIDADVSTNPITELCHCIQTPNLSDELILLNFTTWLLVRSGLVGAIIGLDIVS